LALATHYFAVVAVAPQAGWLLWLHRRDRRVWLSIAAVAAVGLALLPLALSQTNNTAWIAATPLGDRLSEIPPQFVLGTGAPARGWLKLAGALALGLAALLLVLRTDPRERVGALLLAGLTGAGLLLAVFLIAAGYDELISRNIAILLLYLIVLVAAGLGARRAGPAGLAGAATLCSIGVIAVVAVDTNWAFERPDWGGVARALQSEAPPGASRAILVENTDSLEPLNLYVPGLHVLFDQARIRELDIVSAVRAPSGGLCWWGAACHVVPLPLDTALRLPGWRSVAPVLHLDQFSIYRLRASKPIRLTRAEVSRAINPTLLASYGLFVAPPS
jgi:hypothetical protein